MPHGKRAGSAVSSPEPARGPCQPSSSSTYLYPAERMPSRAMASTTLTISAWSSDVPNVLYGFQPMAGRAGSAGGAATGLRTVRLAHAAVPGPAGPGAGVHPASPAASMTTAASAARLLRT
jgi:hypothetical protein